MKSYRRLTVECPNPEDDSFDFHELGALGVEVGVDELTIFLADEQSIAEAAVDLCARKGWRIRSFEQLENKNWVQACADIWRPITVGRVTISPLVESVGQPAPGSGTILIIPGEGFGTGHHPSTRLAMSHIQNAETRQCRSILDFGTGNGILAIAAALEYTVSKVDAIDNDASAVANARENVELNRLTSRINLSVNSIEQMKGGYDMIIANIYAEVLCQYHDHMISRLNENGVLILAGIMESRAEMIRERFHTSCSTVSETGEDGWTSFLYKKNGTK